MDYERVVLDNLPLVDSIVGAIARRYRLSSDEAKELGASVRLKLVDRDYEVLRRFKNQSSLRTYLTAVINRHFLDKRIAAWGKWRPSAIARRLGPHAVMLDQLLTRDGVETEQAVQQVMARHDVGRPELEDLAAQLPHRTSRRPRDEADLERVPAAGGESDTIAALDHSTASEAVEAALGAALARLEPQDRILLKMRFLDQFTVARISRQLGLDQKGLYRRLADVLQLLRGELEQRGVGPEAVAALVGHPQTDLEGAVGWSAEGKAAGGPSVP